MRTKRNNPISDPLSALTCLRFYVNGADPNQLWAGAEDRKWTLSFSHVRELLEFLDPKVRLRCAVIDGHEPALDEKPLLRLLGVLQLYGWETILITNGTFVRFTSDLKETLRRLFHAGTSWIQVELNSLILKTIGLDCVTALYREMDKNFFFPTTRYRLDGDPESRAWLYRLLENPDFNKIHQSFSVFSPLEENGGRQSLSRDTVKQPPITELIVGNHGTLALYCGENQLSKEKIKLSEDGWKDILERWIAQKKETVYAAV